MNTEPTSPITLPDPWYVEGKDGHYLSRLEPEQWSEHLEQALRLDRDHAEHLAERRGDATAKPFCLAGTGEPTVLRTLSNTALVVPPPIAPVVPGPPGPPPIAPVIVEACAHAGHEVLRAYCIARGDPLAVAPPPWQSGVSETDRALVRVDVESVIAGRTPEESHVLWLAAKEKAGWKHGPVKDAAKKEDPSLVPYAELSPEQRTKDDLFCATVRKLASALFSHSG